MELSNLHDQAYVLGASLSQVDREYLGPAVASHPLFNPKMLHFEVWRYIEMGWEDHHCKVWEDTSHPWPPLHRFGSNIPHDEIMKFKLGMIIVRILVKPHLYYSFHYDPWLEGKGEHFFCKQEKEEDAPPRFWEDMWTPLDKSTSK